MILLLIGATLTVFVRDSWPLYLFCIAVMLTLAVIACKRQLDRVSLLPLLIPAFGLLQLALSASAYAPATRTAALRWFALAGVFLLAQSRLSTEREPRERFLDQFVAFAAVTSILCLLQLHSSQGKVLWLFDTGYDDIVYAFFPSRNNYGQFVELALPVALCRAMTDRQRGMWFGLAAGLLYASAIASTSRGAALIATLELLTVPAIALWRSRKSQVFNAALLYAGVLGLALVWTAVTGWDATWKRFGEPEQQGRREFVQSAFQMARQHPLLGNGLDTFPMVYPKFALLDTPERVNHAHNDWAEFAADGGFPFAVFILGLFVTSIPRMTRHPWSLGIVFVLIHAGVDYPFPRVAIAGWMFALLGCLRTQGSRRRSIGWAVPAAVTVCCVLGIYWSLRLGIADQFFHQDTPSAIRRAIAIVPDEARYYARLAKIEDSSDAGALLEQAVRRNPWDAGSLAELGVDAELHGNLKLAEASLLKAAQQDTTWNPQWTLANYYFRRSNAPAFWSWTQTALAHASDRRDFKPLFGLALQINPDPRALLKVIPHRAAPLRGFVAYLLETRHAEPLEEAAGRLIDCGSEGFDRPYVLWSIEGLLSHHRPDGAVRLWTKLQQRGWIDQDAGASFTERPLQSSLDWRYQDVNGVTRTLGFHGRLRLQFSGQQPEETSLLERFVPVRAGVKQRLEWTQEKASLVESEAGIRWEIQSLAGALLATSDLQTGGVEFTPAESIVRVRLQYRRAPGTSRIIGAIDLPPARVVSPATVTS